jgi:2-dehydropantoate 2-reductase
MLRRVPTANPKQLTDARESVDSSIDERSGHTGAMAKVRCGRLDRLPDAVLAGYMEQIKAANIDIMLADHMLLDIWKKFVLLSGTSGTSGITASTRQPLGVIRDDEDMRAFFYKLMHETIAVGRAAGVEFPPDFAAELDRWVSGFAPTMENLDGERS